MQTKKISNNQAGRKSGFSPHYEQSGRNDFMRKIFIFGSLFLFFCIFASFQTAWADITVDFSSSTYTVQEDAGSVTLSVTITRDDPTGTPTDANSVSTTYSVAGAGATAGTDFTAVSGNLSWGLNDTATQTITVPILTDADDTEGDETFTVTLAAITDGGENGAATIGALANNPATVTIRKKVGEFSFSASSYSVEEDNGTVTITVNRSNGLADDVEVDYTANTLTAVAGTDFTAVTGTLTFLAGEDAKTFNVPINPDGLFESDENFTVQLSNPANTTDATTPPTITQNTATVTIVNDDTEAAGAIEFTGPTFTKVEDGTAATIIVERTGGGNGEVVVGYATAQGTAVAGTDYTETTGTLTWADGMQGQQTFTVPVADDGVYEQTETVNLSLTIQSGSATLGAQNTAILNITNDDAAAAPDLAFSIGAAPGYFVNEGPGNTATITVNRTGGEDLNLITVDYATADNTAIAGVHYVASSGKLSFGPTTTSATFTVEVIDNGDAPGADLILDLALANAVDENANPVPISVSASQLTILDDDIGTSPGIIEFKSASYSAFEDDGTVSITVTRTGGSTGPASIPYSTDDTNPSNTATLGTDYGSASGTLNWNDGEDGDKTFSVPLIDDSTDPADVESAETVALMLDGTSVTGAAAGTLLNATLSIRDKTTKPEDPNPGEPIDNEGSLTFNTSTTQVNEDAGTLTLEVLRVNGTMDNITVDYATTNQTATSGSDYTATVGTLAFAAGEMTKTITVPILNDALSEGNETFQLTLSNPTSGADLGLYSTITVTILDTSPSQEPTEAFFPHIDTTFGWETELALLNPTNSTVSGSLNAFDENGNLLSSIPVSIPPNGRREVTVSLEFPSANQIGNVIFQADQGNFDDLLGYTKFFIMGENRVAVPTQSEANAGDVYLSHIDSSATWWTGVSLLNTTNASKTLTFEFNNGETRFLTLGPGENRVFTIRDEFFGGNTPAGVESAVIRNASGIVGLELFGSQPGSGNSYLSGVALKDDTATELYFPHIEITNGWWTGIVVYNPGIVTNTVEFIPYDAAGNRLTPSIFQNIGANAKAVYNVADMGLPAGSAWLRVQAQSPITGFELFGTLDGRQLGGYTGVNIAKSTGVFPKIERTGGWTGIALVNPNSTSTSVTLTAFNDAGNVIASETINLLPNQKIVDLVEEVFFQNISAATYVKYEASNNLVGFQLNGSADGFQLDALPGM